MRNRDNDRSAWVLGIARRIGGRASRATERMVFPRNSIDNEFGWRGESPEAPVEMLPQSSVGRLFWVGVMPLDGNILTKRTTRMAVRARVAIGIRPSLRLDPTR